MKLFDPQLSRIRTLLFGAMAFVWFSEMMLWGFQTLSKMWTNTWIIASEDARLAMALYITHSLHAPAKGALGVMAVYGLMSKNPFTRAALFVSMALVPPLNLAFPFRAQGFPLAWVVIPTTLSLILWGAFFAFKEPVRQPDQGQASGAGQSPPSPWEAFQYFWFAANSAALTVLASLCLFWPTTALNLVHPCFSGWLNAEPGRVPSLVYSGMATGTHLLALAVASWIATVYCRSQPALRRAVAMASTVHAGLFIIFPLRQITTELGGSCATSSILFAFVPLFVGWLLYAAFSYREERSRREGRRG